MKRTVLLVSIVLALLTVSIATAQTGGGYDLSWSTVDAGGGSSSGGGYSLDGTGGQPDANTATGGGYVLSGGFWGGGAMNQVEAWAIFLPVILR
jgi:hypothetical protein